MRKSCPCALFIGVIVWSASASSVVCQSGWDWASNSKRQNPCGVAGVLEATCRGNATFKLAPLTQKTNYPTPQTSGSTGDCDCNIVMFSLYMACTACQNAPTQPWIFWIQNCTKVNSTHYPGVIPLDTAIPNWAYNFEGNFDPAVASSVGDQPERPISTPANSPSSSSVSRTPSIPIFTSTSGSTSAGGGPSGSNQSTALGPSPSSQSDNPTSAGSPEPTSTPMITPSASPTDAGPTPTPTSAPPGLEPSSKVGIIIGGVFGALALLGVVTWYFRRVRQVSGEEGSRDDSDHPIRSSGGEALMSVYGTQPSRLRTYDPSDPSTFPEQARNSIVDEGYAAKKGHYSGLAEL